MDLSRLTSKLPNLIIATTIFWQGCSQFNRDITRRPANDPKSLTFEREKEFIESKIYRFRGPLVFPPVRWLIEVIGKSKVKDFLKELPLENEVRNRIMAKLDDKDFMNQLFPFLMAMQEIYMAKEKDKKKNFETHIKRFWPNHNALPGLKHSLFEYSAPKKKKVEDKDKSGESGGVSKKMLARAVALVDSILFKDLDFRFGQKPNLSEERIFATMPVVKDLMDQVVSDFEIPEAYKEIVHGIVNDPKRLETLTISLSELVLKTIYSNYQMFAKQYHRTELLKDWLLREAEKKDDSQLWAYLKEALNERRFVVHIVVDGLQGNLVESLTNPGPAHPFLKSVYEEHTNRQQFKPKKVEYKEMGPTQHDFLKFLMGQSRDWDHPSYLPFFKDLYLKGKNGLAEIGVSTTPTISVRNIPMASNGAPVDGPGGTLLPNFHYVDRKKDRAYYFFGNDALRFEDLAKEIGMKSLFERMPYLGTMNCNNQFTLGSDQIFEPLINIAAGEVSRDFGEIICTAELEKRMRNEVRAREIRQRLLGMEDQVKHWHRTKRLRRGPIDDSRGPMLTVRALLHELGELENRGMPAYLNYYIPWPDHFAHFKGPFSDEIISPTGELNRLDYWLGRAQEIYKQAGIFNNTVWGMAGDHGLAPIYFFLNPEVSIFENMKKEGTEIKVKKISSDEGEGPKLNHPFKPNSVKGVDVVIASTAGGNYMMDFFVDQGSNWDRQPVNSELRDLQLLSGKKVDMINEIVTRLDDTLDYYIIRNKECNSEHTDIELGRLENGTHVKARVIRQGERVFYQAGSVDVLDVSKMNHYRKDKNLSLYHNLYQKCVKAPVLEDVSSWCFEDEWRKLTSFTPRPDSVVQVAHIYDSDFAGTVNLFPKPGIGYNTKVPGRHAGEHFHEKDAFVGVWGQRVNAPTRVRSHQNGSIPVVLYEFISGKHTRRGSDGWGFDSFIDELNINFKE